jgi:hypothetical protein
MNLRFKPGQRARILDGLNKGVVVRVKRIYAGETTSGSIWPEGLTPWLVATLGEPLAWRSADCLEQGTASEIVVEDRNLEPLTDEEEGPELNAMPKFMKLNLSKKDRFLLLYVGLFLVVCVVAIAFAYSGQPTARQKSALFFIFGSLWVTIFMITRHIREIGETQEWLIATLQTIPVAPKIETASAAAVDPEKTLWPWGDYTNRHLDDMNAVAQALWARYTPSNPKTAPTIEMVVKWLIAERGTTPAKAAQIASILRAESVPSGRRPNGP